VLVEVSHCGVCGTDLHLVLEQYARPGTVLGHEWAGAVAALGPEVDGWAIGDLVVANPAPGCGECRACLRGRPAVCLRREPIDLLEFRGAFCRYVVVSAARLLRLPPGLAPRVAALAEPLAIALHTVGLAGVAPADRVLITGGGPVGLLILAVLRARGVDDVTVSEPTPLRRERALALGARRAVEPAALPRAPMGRAVPEPFAVVFECSGHAAAAESALDQLEGAGTLVFVGTGRDLPRVNHNRAIVMELTLIGAYNYDDAGFGPALELLASGVLPFDLLVEPVDVGLDGLATALARLAEGEIASKQLVVPRVEATEEEVHA
jgi:(R,R)-butanediol dehydrogenase/meso-butanediol dehydrogenase/diacetyl reductase